MTVAPNRAGLNPVPGPCENSTPGEPHAKRPTTRKGPRSPWLCTSCSRADRRARKTATALKRIEKVYGLTPDDLELVRGTLPVNERGVPVCPGCKRATGATKALAVDHDHDLERRGLPARETVRGILCGPCNQTIGRYSPAQLRALADYVEDPPAPKVLRTGKFR